MLHRNLEHINPEYMRLDTRSENKQTEKTRPLWNSTTSDDDGND